MDNPIRLYSNVEVKLLSLFCDEDECNSVQLILEGAYATQPEAFKYRCPRCMKEFITNDKSGIVYIPVIRKVSETS